MLTTIHITVRDRVPTITAGEDVISHNSDYVAEFEFDEEWHDKVKTVFFVCEDGSYQAVVMDGNSCGVPMLDGEHRRIFVGVQAGAAEKPSVLKTTRPCCIKVKDSIADYLGQPIPDPTPDVYQQIMAMLESITSPTWDSLQNKPFSTLGSGLEVDENGVLSAQGGGGGSANAVQYVAQELTDEQKKQARANIGASPIPTVRYWLNLTADNIINLYNMGVGYGIISPVDNDQTVPTGMSSPMLVIFGRMNSGRVDITVYDGAGAVWSGSLNLSSQTTDVTKTGDYVTNTALADILQGYVLVEEFEVFLQQTGQELNQKLYKNQGTANAGKILGIGADGIVVPQDNPTYTLPPATADALGGIKADAATAEDTQVVRIGTDGKLRTKPTGGSSITVDSELSSTSENPVQNKIITAALAEKITAPTTAAVGQIIKVKSVDGTGKPTEWEAVDLPSGGAYTLPIASPTVLGGVKPIAKTDAMTQGVGVDEAGALWTAAEGGAYKILVDQTLEEAASVNIQMTEEMSKCNEYIIHIVSPAGESNVNYNRYTTIAENDWLVNNIRIIDAAYGTVHAYHIVKVSTDHLWVDIYSANTQSRTPGIDFAPRTNWANNRRTYRSRNTPGVLYKSSVELLAGTIIVILGR